MLEDAYKSCPDVICIRAGISVQLSVVANVYFNGLLCNPCCADLSGLICMFSAMPAHCFWRFFFIFFSPIAVEMVTGESKKCNTCRSPGGVLAELGAKLVGVGWDRELSPATTGCAGSLFYPGSCNKQKGGFIKRFLGAS